MTENVPKLKMVELGLKDDALEVFAQMYKFFSICFLFESRAEGGLLAEGRYAYIGFEPEKVISAKAQVLTVDDQSTTVENPYHHLKTFLPETASDPDEESYPNGLVGYLGYDAVNYLEPALQVKTHPDFDQFKFGLYTDGLRYDPMTRELTYFYHHTDRSALVEKALNQPVDSEPVEVKFLGDSLTAEEHTAGVGTILKEIKAGNTFQTQFGFKRKFTVKGNHLEIYRALRQVSPSPYLYYLKFGDQTLMGASPELLFRMTHGLMETFPLAGTTRRGTTPTEDAQLEAELLQDPKEIAEHNMLVDLHRNDIGRVAEIGSVRVRKMKEVKKFSHVQHISSEITGQLKTGGNMFEALASNFPAGTLSGAPKIESMKIIDRSEPESRGPYGGAVGYFGLNQDCAFSIPIRSVFISQEQGFMQASGGIVADSQPEKEYREIQNKLAGMNEVMTQFQKDEIMKVLIVDNYDSFTFNLYQLVGEVLQDSGQPFELVVKRNDEISFSEIAEQKFHKIIISPGPGDASDAHYFGVCKAILESPLPEVRVLGVCLGLQGLAHYYGGTVVKAPEPVHGKTSQIQHDGKGVFQGLPQDLVAMRYHSLVVDPASVPECLEVSAQTADGLIMGLRHKTAALEGVQFHPESFATQEGRQLIQNFLFT